MPRNLTSKNIKSAKRVLEVLEFFNSERQQATLMEIVRSLGYPQSSTSELLACLVALGYLRIDYYERTYTLTAKVPLVGAWVQPRLFRSGSLFPMMDELAEQSGASVVLATKAGLEIQYIHAVSGTGKVEPCWASGAKTSLLHSAAGKALLSITDVRHVRKIVHRLNAEAEPEMWVTADTLIGDLREVTAKGYAVGADEPGGAMVAVLLPQPHTEEQLVLGLGGPTIDLATGAEEVVRLLRAAIARHLGPVMVAPPAPSAVSAGASIRLTG